jgi:hypothetical protein
VWSLPDVLAEPTHSSKSAVGRLAVQRRSSPAFLGMNPRIPRGVRARPGSPEHSQYPRGQRQRATTVRERPEGPPSKPEARARLDGSRNSSIGRSSGLTAARKPWYVSCGRDASTRRRLASRQSWAVCVLGLEVLTESADVAVEDDAGGEAEEGFVDVVVAFPADAQPFHAVGPGDGAFDAPADAAEAGAAGLSSAGELCGGSLGAGVGGTCRGHGRGRARPTGRGPLLGHGVRPGPARSRSHSGPSRACPPGATPPAAARAAASTPRPCSTPRACVRRSSRSRRPAPAAGTPTGSRCATRTGSRTAPADRAAAHARGSVVCAAPPTATARSAATDRPSRSTAATHPSSRPNMIHIGLPTPPS